MPLSGAGNDCRFRAALLTPASRYERREATPIVLVRLRFVRRAIGSWRRQNRFENPIDSPRGSICTEIGSWRVVLQYPAAKPSSRAAEQPPGDNIALPMFPTFQAGDGIVDWQRFKCPDPWIVFGVIDDQGCDEARLQRHLAARKAVTAAALKP